MKKITALVLAALFCITAFVLASCGEKEDSGTKSDVEIETSVTSVPTDESLDASSASGAPENSTEVSDKEAIQFQKSEAWLLIEKTDEDYQKECSAADTTAEMIDVSLKYADIYRNIANDYYNRIMSYENEDWIENPDFLIPSLEDFKDSVSELKTNWEDYYNKENEIYGEIIGGIYGRGTLRGPTIAAYRCEMCRAWAEKVIGIYEQLQ